MEQMEQIRQQNRHLQAHNALLRATQPQPSSDPIAPPGPSPLTSKSFVPQSQSLASVLSASDSTASAPVAAPGSASFSGASPDTTGNTSMISEEARPLPPTRAPTHAAVDTWGHASGHPYAGSYVPQAPALSSIYETALARDRQESLEVQRKLNQPLGPELTSTRPGPSACKIRLYAALPSCALCLW